MTGSSFYQNTNPTPVRGGSTLDVIAANTIDALDITQAGLDIIQAADPPAQRSKLGFTAAGTALVTAADAATQRIALEISASNTPSVATGGVSATNVQAAIAELDSEKAAKAANLSDLTNTPTARTNLGITAAGNAIVTAADAAAQRTALEFTAAGSIIVKAADAAAQRSALSISAANTPSTATGGVGATNVQAAIAELDTEKANLASSDFTVLKRGGKDIYGALPVFANGGDESDMNTTAQSRLSVTFVAIAPNCTAKTVMTSDNQGAANFAGIWLRLTDVTAGNVTLVQHATSGYVGASATMTLTSILDNPTALTIGSTYRIDLVVVKTIAAGPIYPRNMRISAQNF